MSAQVVQIGMLLLLAVIALVAVLILLLLRQTLALVRDQQSAVQRFLTDRDFGPALHGLVQQTKEVNRLLANIDKRLEKLEALEKVQIANLTFREEARTQR